MLTMVNLSLFLLIFTDMRDLILERSLTNVSNVAKHSRGPVTFTHMNKLKLERSALNISNVGKHSLDLRTLIGTK